MHLNHMAAVSRKMVLVIMLLTGVSAPSTAQHQDAQLLAYNTLLGAVTATIGAVINKPAGARLGKVMLRSAWQGALGGTLRYSAKKTLFLIADKQEPGYALPAMILQNAGNSIVNNAAYNRPFLSTWNIDYGFLRFDFATGRAAQSPRVRLLPAAVYGIFAAAGQSSVNWTASLASGCPVFTSGELLTVRHAKIDVAAAVCHGRAIVVNPSYTHDPLEAIGHELVHYFQYTDYLVCNTWGSKAARRLAPGWLEKIVERYLYCDLPYASIPYVMEGYQPIETYYDNFFEFEAQRFMMNADLH